MLTNSGLDLKDFVEWAVLMSKISSNEAVWGFMVEKKEKNAKKSQPDLFI